ncbi:hypothetical protein ACIG3E_21950 [Streptomyces sp. NPDC053474]|uniref:hypothetical protein n=1 Tax=Streptomyces sp. NPDC053474 TaxID=3365704 RepID=UPI0037D3D842
MSCRGRRPLGRDALRALGVTLVVLGGQGAIRQLVDHDDAGVLGGLPGGFVVCLSVHAACVIVGAAVAGRAHGLTKQSGRGS